jgi:hypothetical protein
MSKIMQNVVATLGAIILSATAVGAAVGPARAVETASVQLAATQFSGQVNA